MLFASVNALAKSFLSESRGRQLYYYSLVSAPVFYLSKLLYGIILMLVLSVISLIIFSVLNGTPAWNFSSYLLALLLGATGLHIPIKFSLGFVALVLVGSVLASLWFPPKEETTIKVDLPPDFDLPLGEELNKQDKKA
jgi:heme exporter protein B